MKAYVTTIQGQIKWLICERAKWLQEKFVFEPKPYDCTAKGDCIHLKLIKHFPIGLG